MALPTGYATETALAEYMHSVLGNDEDVARHLGWSVAGGDYDEAVHETMFAYGTDDLSTVTGMNNVRKLRAIAKRELWALIMQRTADSTDTSGGIEGGGESHSQFYTHAKQQYQMADAQVMTISAEIVTVTSRPTMFARAKGRRGV